MSAIGAGADVGVGRNQSRQKFVSFSPSVSSDSMLDFVGNHDRGVNLEINESAFVSDEHGRTAIRPANPAESGEERSGGASGESPP